MNEKRQNINLSPLSWLGLAVVISANWFAGFFLFCASQAVHNVVDVFNGEKPYSHWREWENPDPLPDLTNSTQR